jgi:hypothetical protein
MVMTMAKCPKGNPHKTRREEKPGKATEKK